MAGILIRTLLGLCYFGIGIFWACIVIPGMFVKTILGGRKGFEKLFKRRSHDECPEVARKGFNHDFVRTRSGMRFHYVHAGPEDKPLMLCLHGFPECWYSWKHVIKRFSSDYHVVAYDMRGYGDSDKPQSIGQYHTDYLVNDVQEIITALGYERAIIVAHDWGGAAAWRVPCCFPNVVDKLIIMNAPSREGLFAFGKDYPSQFLKSWYMFLFQIPYLPEFLTARNDFKSMENMMRGHGSMSIRNPANVLTMDEVEVYKHYAARHIRYGINYYRAMNPLYTGMNLKPVTQQIVQPTLVIWGGEDQALDKRMVPYLTKHLRNAKSLVVDGASHWVMLDEPTKVMDAMESFLEDEEQSS